MTAIRVRDVDLECVVLGDGRPLIWGHGLSSSMAGEDLFGVVQLPRVSELCRVVRYDARGHGLSMSTESPQGYHWRELARDQLALADALGIESYIAAGASMGTATALHAAVLAPERIEAMVLAIPPTAWDSRPAQRDGYLTAARLVEAGELDELIEASAASPPPDPMAGVVELWRDGYATSLRAADRVRLARVYRGAATADLPEPDQIAALRVPTLVLAWTGDPGHPMSTAERLVELMPHASLHAASTLDDLLGWTDIVLEFVRSLPVRRR